jgi:hypothetical protein
VTDGDQAVSAEAENVPEENVPEENVPEEAEPAPNLQVLADQGTLSEHLASVLRAAEVAAQAIKEEAEKEAQRLLERSEQEATTLREANRDAAALIAEAERACKEAEAAAEVTRQGADLYVEQKQKEAEVVAAQVIAAAERDAVARALAVEAQHRSIQDGIEQTGERLKQLVTGLRDLAGKLEDLAIGATGKAPPSIEESSTNKVRESLVESLKASIAQESVAAERAATEE